MCDQAAVVEATDMPKEMQQQLLQGPFGLWRNGKLKEITVIIKRMFDCNGLLWNAIHTRHQGGTPLWKSKILWSCDTLDFSWCHLSKKSLPKSRIPEC
uniref:Uncharacterized protein n=1 Tax=Cyanoderma ruficeps TaxID=181631 RepID=A0A8C3QJ97_9PASS